MPSTGQPDSFDPARRRGTEGGLQDGIYIDFYGFTCMYNGTMYIYVYIILIDIRFRIMGTISGLGSAMVGKLCF